MGLGATGVKGGRGSTAISTTMDMKSNRISNKTKVWRSAHLKGLSSEN
jgi:hypothetical protein